MLPARKHTVPSSPVFQVSEEIRVSYQVLIHREIFIKSLPGPLPRDRNRETLRINSRVSLWLESISLMYLVVREESHCSVILQHFLDDDKASIASCKSGNKDGNI